MYNAVSNNSVPLMLAQRSFEHGEHQGAARSPSAPPIGVGIRLEGSHVQYRPTLTKEDAGQSSGERQLEVTPITLYNTEYVYNFGALIAVNNTYICYAIKGGQIRVINKNSGGRALLKAHTQPITDLRFFSPDVDVLASVGRDGNVFVWRIYEKPEDGAISHEVLLQLSSDTAGGEGYFRRFAWHPLNGKVFATATSVMLSPPSSSSPVTAFNATIWMWTRKCILAGHLQVVNDLSFSLDGRLIATGSEDGVVRVWDVPTCLAALDRISGSNTGSTDGSMHGVGVGHSPTPPSSSAPASANCSLDFVAHAGKAVTAVMFTGPSRYHLQLTNPMSAPPAPAPAGMSRHLITAASNNTEVKLWEVSSWSCLQTVTLVPGPGPSLSPGLGMDLDHDADADSLYNIMCVDMSGSFLLLANTRANSLFVLHLSSSRFSSASMLPLSSVTSPKGLPGPQSFPPSSSNPAPSASLDYISEFSVAQPILSFTVTNAYRTRSLAAGQLPSVMSLSELQVYCVQTKAIQQYHLRPEMCLPPPFALSSSSSSSSFTTPQSPATVVAAPPLPGPSTSSSSTLSPLLPLSLTTPPPPAPSYPASGLTPPPPPALSQVSPISPNSSPPPPLPQLPRPQSFSASSIVINSSIPAPPAEHAPSLPLDLSNTPHPPSVSAPLPDALETDLAKSEPPAFTDEEQPEQATVDTSHSVLENSNTTATVLPIPKVACEAPDIPPPAPPSDDAYESVVSEEGGPSPIAAEVPVPVPNGIGIGQAVSGSAPRGGEAADDWESPSFEPPAPSPPCKPTAPAPTETENWSVNSSEASVVSVTAAVPPPTASAPASAPATAATASAASASATAASVTANGSAVAAVASIRILKKQPRDALAGGAVGGSSDEAAEGASGSCNSAQGAWTVVNQRERPLVPKSNSRSNSASASASATGSGPGPGPSATLAASSPPSTTTTTDIPSLAATAASRKQHPNTSSSTNARPAQSNSPLRVPAGASASVGAELPVEGPLSPQVPTSSISVEQLQAALAKEGKRLETSITSRLEKYYQQLSDKQQARLDREKGERERLERERYERLLMAITSLSSTIPQYVQRDVQKELQSLVPQMHASLAQSIDAMVTKPLQDALKTQFAQAVGPKLEKTVKDVLSSVVTKQMNESVADKLIASMRSALHETFKMNFHDVLVPAFEMSCRKMFEQINDTFDRGLDDRIQKPLNDFFRSAHQNTLAEQQASKNMLGMIENVNRSVIEMHKSMEEQFRAAEHFRVQREREEEVDSMRRSQSMDDAAAALPVPTNLSRSASRAQNYTSHSIGSSSSIMWKVPAPKPVDPRLALTVLINEHRYQEAFLQVLSSSDLDLLSWLCNALQAHSILAISPLPISQPVLLSLIQQLSADLSLEPLLKFTWLRDACIALDTREPSIATYVPGILHELQNNLLAWQGRQHAMAADNSMTPTTFATITSGCKLLMHVVRSMLGSDR
mmetsp:Transcript_43107/g.71781  ORF Transcript_43107/g.71781 Transcript_43107/m.71781 type:complete len:1471 (+) Transcript_43107:67-4479(+)